MKTLMVYMVYLFFFFFRFSFDTNSQTSAKSIAAKRQNLSTKEKPESV